MDEVATLLKALQERCDTSRPVAGLGFSFAFSPTRRVTGDHPLQASFLPVTQDRYAVAWSATYYRGRRLYGELLVVDAIHLERGKLVVLRGASQLLDLVDLQLLSLGADLS